MSRNGKAALGIARSEIGINLLRETVLSRGSMQIAQFEDVSSKAATIFDKVSGQTAANICWG